MPPSPAPFDHWLGQAMAAGYASHGELLAAARAHDGQARRLLHQLSAAAILQSPPSEALEYITDAPAVMAYPGLLAQVLSGRPGARERLLAAMVQGAVRVACARVDEGFGQFGEDHADWQAVEERARARDLH